MFALGFSRVRTLSVVATGVGFSPTPLSRDSQATLVVGDAVEGKNIGLKGGNFESKGLFFLHLLQKYILLEIY